MQLSIPAFNHLHILVFGDAMLDSYLHGNTSRISPEAPVQIVHVTHKEERAGGVGNVAINIAALGAKVSLFALCGDDEAGMILKETLKNAGVDAYFECHPHVQTTLKQRIISLHQQLIRLDFEAPYHDHNFSTLINAYREQLPKAQAVIFSDYGKGVKTTAADIIRLASQAQIPIIVDPKGVDFSPYQGATILTPNRKEFEAVVGACANETQIKEKAFNLIESLQLEALLITRGEQGMSLFSHAFPEIRLPTRACEVYDVTGAGDTVAAILGLAIAAGESLPDAVALANTAGGIVVGKLGAATVSLAELQQALFPNNPSDHRVMTEAQLLVTRQLARTRKERVVMTNGCFDILHAGHVAYLEEAKALGDRLIVAVNDDASVERLKGPPRPINRLEHRMAVLASLSVVDWVVPFSEDTPERLIAQILPDVLVKGGDYQPDQIAGAQAVLQAGGEVKVLQFVENCSTSSMIQKIRYMEEIA